LGEQSEQFVLTSPASVNAGGYQEGSIFTQSTVAIGAEHMCMILDNASVACWGEGADGQLGNNDTSYQSAPVYVSSFGPGRTATAITAGARHTCALLDNGSVSCWGNGEEGQLGNGALQSSSSVPSPVLPFPSGQRAITLSSGYAHTCAILDDGAVACWGAGSEGRLGNGGTSSSASPQLTDSLGENRSAKSISSGHQHTCAILDNGSTVCWGDGSKGQLGKGSLASSSSPAPIAAIPSAFKPVALASGDGHTCALLSKGSVVCWGSGLDGFLGSGSTSDQLTPEAVEPFGEGRTAVAISAKHRHTCAVLSDGNVSCWGVSANGRGGNDGVENTQLVPTLTSSLGVNRTALSITSGHTYSCAILDDFSVSCWGDAPPGVPGSTQPSPTPLSVLPALRSVAVSERDFNGNGVFNIFETPIRFDFKASGLSAGYKHTCAILDDDSITCWGDNANGQLGTGDKTNHLTPATTLSLGAGRTAQAVDAGWTHTCALLDNGSVSCWGEQYLTNNTKVDLTSPTLVGDFGNNRTAVQISTGSSVTCAVLSDGTVSCWGKGTSGQLGNGATTSSTDPTPTTSFGAGKKALSVSLYSDHACALIDDGTVMCWGRNDYGKLGDGTESQRNAPVQVNPFPVNTTPISVAVGSHHSCALLDVGDVSCWGEGTYGQNGDGTSANRPSPGRTSGFGAGKLAVSVSSGDHHICALLDSGEVVCWGEGGSGRLGTGSSSRVFVPTPTVSFGDGKLATSLAVGAFHGCVVLDSGEISCWGGGLNGQLGNGETSNQASPVLTKTLGPSVSSISAGGDHSCALLGNGSVACWGRGAEGQLGDGNTTNQIAPVFVSSFGSGRSAVAISAGLYHTCALLDNGSVSCWGTGWQGALGNGDSGQQNTPILTSSFGAGRTAVALSAGHGYTCAVLDNGSVACWGDNTYGQLGDGTTQGRFTPVLTDSLGAGRTAIDVTTKESHTCALLDNGSISCWGRGISGVLGNGSSVNQNTPTLVSSLGVGRTAVAVSAGAMHTCAILDNGEVSCWGYGNGGRLGNGVRPDKYTPTLTSTLGSGRTAVAISLGFDHTCAVLDDGSASCWGVGSDGQLGNGGTSDQFNPTPASSVASERSVVGLAAGKYRTCVVLDNQSVACTGKGTAGQIGNNDTSNQVNFTYTIPLVIPRSLAIDNGDQDGDGVADPLDAYPEDIMRAAKCVAPTYGRYVCTTVGLGKYVPANDAIYPTDASIGHYVDLVGQVGERPCPVGTYNPTTSAEVFSACLGSGPGHFVDSIGQGEQAPCDVGTFQPGTRSQFCLPSDLGHFVNMTAQISQIPCPIGTFQNETEQVDCRPAEWGHFANETGQVNQTACHEGFYNPDNGSTLATDCRPADIGHFVNQTGSHNQTECAIGTLQNQTGQPTCLNASRGHYVSLVAQSTEVPCSVGTYNPLRGANNSTWCLPATRGHFVNQTGQGDQTPCLGGTYNPLNGSSNPGDCLDADLGHHVASSGQWNQTPCALGTYENQTGQVLCNEADRGHFVNQTAQTSQQKCPQGSYQSMTGQSFCFRATSGHFVSLEGQANQTACGIGTFNPNVSSINASDCIDAMPGHFANLTGQGEQTPCSIGTYNPVAGSNSSDACLNASSGYYVNLTGSADQTPCPTGTFNSDEASNSTEACQWASRGHYVDGVGQSGEVPCPAGTYNPTLGMDSIEACLEVEAGYYVNETGQDRQTPCRVGTFNPDVGSTTEFACQLAELNHYVPLEGQTVQTPCPTGTSQDTPGQASCNLGTFEVLPTNSTPQEAFQLLFLIVSALMLTMGFVLYRRVKNRRRRGGKTMDAMQRRYRY
jgi:alpha-tubulin suppressor-like RCC1 family protein